MTVQTKTTLKSYFETGDKPTEANFIDLIDTMGTVDASGLATSTTPGTVTIASSAQVKALSASAGVAISPEGLGELNASTTQRGILRIATSAEVIEASANNIALTPSNLNSRDALTTQTGLVALATTAEAVAGNNVTKALSPSTGKALLQSNSNVSPRGYIDFIIEDASADSNHDIVFNTGIARDSTNTVDIVRGSPITKQLDAFWVSGDSQGGLPNNLSTSAANTTYHCFVIRDPSGVVDAGFDTNVSANNLLAQASAYTTYRRVGSIITDSSAHVRQFTQYGDEFFYKRAVTTVSAITHNSGTPTAIQTTAVATPVNIVTEAILVGYVLKNLTVTTDALMYLAHAFVSAAPSPIPYQVVGNSSGTGDSTEAAAEVRVITDTSANINFIVNGSFTAGSIRTLGWKDLRGKDSK